MEDSCEETIVPSDDSAESCDEKLDAQRKGARLTPQINVIGPSPAFAAKSPALCPWPSTPEFMPLYKTDIEADLSLPPCAEELLPISLLDSPCMEEGPSEGGWEQSWPQMYWAEETSYGYLDTVAQPVPDAATRFYNGPAEADWTQQTKPAWADQPWTESPQVVKPPLPRSRGSAENVAPETRTTVMLKNMPNNQTRKMLLELLDRESFALRYDFVYLPYDFQTGATLGYAFVNFTTPAAALEAFERFEGYAKWTVPSRKVCGVGWSEPHQGLVPHIQRYRDSPVMHHDVPERFKPLILKNGTPVPFPLPTKKLRAPRLRGIE